MEQQTIETRHFIHRRAESAAASGYQLSVVRPKIENSASKIAGKIVNRRKHQHVGGKPKKS